MKRNGARTRLGVGAILGFLVSALPQEPQTEPPTEEAQAEATETEAPPAAPPAPDGILPVSEIGRIEHGPRDRTRPLLHERTLVLVTSAGLVEAYDSAAAAFLWRLGLPGQELFQPVLFRSEPLEILLSSPSGQWMVVAGKNGEIVHETSLDFELALAPVPSGDALYFGTPQGMVLALDSKTGAKRFRTETIERPFAFAVGGGLLVVSGAERTLTALDAKTGQPRWSFRGRGRFSPAVFRESEDRLYVGDDAGEFYCLSAEKGDVHFRWSTGAAIRAPALVLGKRVYVASYGNNLYAYDSGGGSEQWRTSLPGRPATGPVLVGKRLLVATLDGVFAEVEPDRGRITRSYTAPGELASPPAFWIAEGSTVVEAENAATAATPSAPPPTPAYEKHRIALTLRSGQVLLLGHQKPEPVVPEEPEKEAPEKPPTERVP